MGIQLDWDIESDSGRRRKLSEDSALQERRRVILLRLVIVISIFLAIIGLIIFLISQRLQQVEQRLETLLVNTVQAEVAALRIGDRPGFQSIQRSATDDWLLAQDAEFARYQALKTDVDIQFTGRVESVAIDGQRGRVQVEEIIDNVPYLRTWFYWRYEEEVVNGRVVDEGGWRHVPPDYTFWGEAASLINNQLAVRYRELDGQVATAMHQQVTGWLATACRALVCGDLPFISIDIVPTTNPEPNWTSELSQWQLVVPSPYVGTARADMPFNVPLQVAVATRLAERLVSHVMNGAEVAYPSDAYYLRSAIVSWLVGRWVQIDTNTFLLTSLVRQYGDEVMGRLAQALGPTSSVQVIAQVLDVPTIADVELDWRDVLTWRLVTERDLILRQDQGNYLQLYDLRDQGVVAMAMARFGRGAQDEIPVVLLVERATAPDGGPQLRAQVQVESPAGVRQEVVLFNLVEGDWRRVN